MPTIAFISFRIAGTDGVSLEIAKWADIYRRAGNRVVYCAGELDSGLAEDGRVIPEMHFAHQQAATLTAACFKAGQPARQARVALEKLALHIENQLLRFVHDYHPDILIAENILALPMNIPMSLAFYHVARRLNLPVIAHHHDFWWERERYRTCCIPELLDEVFPPALPNLRHVVINSLAQQSLLQRRGLQSVVIPNFLDFARSAPQVNEWNHDLRQNLNLGDDFLILQPTRVIRRKGIELSVALVRRLLEPAALERLNGRRSRLVISHAAGDEGQDYLGELRALAQQKGVPLIYAAEHFAPRAGSCDGRKIYSLWDAYLHADFVCYPSLYEGYGNALLEAVYFKCPVMVNRYSVYQADIAPLGFNFIEIDEEITDETVNAVIAALTDSTRRAQVVEWNFQIACQRLSFEAVAPTLISLLKIS